jgi:hypothetical protein
MVHMPGKNARKPPPAGVTPAHGARTAAGDTLFTSPGGEYDFESGQ